MGPGPLEQPGETKDPSSSAIFGLSTPHHAEAARPGTTETSALLLAADLGHREGGHGGAGTKAGLEALSKERRGNAGKIGDV